MSKSRMAGYIGSKVLPALRNTMRMSDDSSLLQDLVANFGIDAAFGVMQGVMTPGDLREKPSPYLRPLHDALMDMMPTEEIERHMERETIEIAPLAYMRGRTLNNAFVILDEAQNATSEQMFMFLTRLGFNSKAVITGDATQVDLPVSKQSGLVEAMDVLRETDGIAIVEFSRKDVVRHPLVQKIILAYEARRNHG